MEKPGEAGKPSKQSLVMIKGHPGCGKSHTARALGKKLGWPVIDKDDAKGPLHAAHFNEIDEEDLNETSYRIMFRVVETQLTCGLSVIIDCPFARMNLFLRVKELAEKFGASVALIECVALNEAIWKARVESRIVNENPEDLHKPPSWEALRHLTDSYKGSFKWSNDVSTDVALQLKLDTTHNVGTDETIDWIVRSLRDQELID